MEDGTGRWIIGRKAGQHIQGEVWKSVTSVTLVIINDLSSNKPVTGNYNILSARGLIRNTLCSDSTKRK